jgi:sodium/bile acid cotransporter 7
MLEPSAYFSPRTWCSASCFESRESFFKKTKEIIIDNFILIAFSIAIIIALSFPYPGTVLGSFQLADKGIVQFINTFIVFFISGITLKIEAFHEISKYYRAIVIGVISINFITTLVAFIFLSCAFLSFQYRLGLAIFCCVPTTLGVGVALSQLSNGDVLLSLLLTVLTNALGTVTTPFLLMFYVSSVSANDQSIHIDSVGLLVSLSLNVLLPTLIGILFRYFYTNSLIKFTKDYKNELSMFSTTNLAMIIWMALSKSRNLLLKQSIGDIFIVLFCVILQHLFYLCGHYLLVSKYLLNFEITQAISLIIMCSQKSNPVALAVINGMGLNSKESGLMIIPGLLGQLSQIFIGSALVQFFQRWYKKHESEAATENSEEKVGDDLEVSNEDARKGQHYILCEFEENETNDDGKQEIDGLQLTQISTKEIKI